MTHTDLLRQALDALELQEPAVGCPREREHWKRTAMPTMDALRAALAQPTPTPDYNDRLTTALYCGDVDELNRVLAEPAPAVNDRIHASAAPAVPDGWVMVPREPTPEMRRVGADVWHLHDGHLTRVIGDVYRAMIATASGSAPAVREPLTAERLQKHAMFAADAPPASAVVLVSSLHRLLGITGDSAPAVQPLTDEQIDEIWDGTFDSADPKRQLSFRQIITRAIERAHGITGDSNG